MTPEYIFHIAFWILLAGVLIMRIIFTIRVRRAEQRIMPDRQAVNREGRGMFAIRVLMGLALGVWLVLYAIDPPWMKSPSVPFPGWLRWAGFILGLASLGFWVWTQVALGKWWSPQLQLREEHHLVTTGPYTHFRHPLYSAMMGFAISLALVTANWFFIFFAAGAIAGTIARVPREEQMMVDGFGDEYRAYMSRTGRYLPKL